MPGYRPIATSAQNLHATEETLLELQRAGWIGVAEKGGRRFLTARDEYRARFILHLKRELKLTGEEIALVLANSKEPYSLEDVPAILRKAAAKS